VVGTGAKVWDDMGQHRLRVTQPQAPEPVFVDRTGRRRRLARAAGIVVGCLLAAYVAVVAFGLVSGAGVPMTPWPAATPSHRVVPPLEARVAAPRDGAKATPTPRATAPSRHVRPAGGAPATTRTTASPTASTAKPGQGHSYGRTKSPNPRKP
jgi:hypothetical protein